MFTPENIPFTPKAVYFLQRRGIIVTGKMPGREVVFCRYLKIK